MEEEEEDRFMMRRIRVGVDHLFVVTFWVRVRSPLLGSVLLLT